MMDTSGVLMVADAALVTGDFDEREVALLSDCVRTLGS